MLHTRSQLVQHHPAPPLARCSAHHALAGFLFTCSRLLSLGSSEQSPSTSRVLRLKARPVPPGHIRSPPSASYVLLNQLPLWFFKSNPVITQNMFKKEWERFTLISDTQNRSGFAVIVLRSFLFCFVFARFLNSSCEPGALPIHCLGLQHLFLLLLESLIFSLGSFRGFFLTPSLPSMAPSIWCPFPSD